MPKSVTPKLKALGINSRRLLEQVLCKVLGAVEEVSDQPPAELLGIRARYKLTFVERVYDVEQELVGAVGDAGRGPYQGAQLLYQERHEEKKTK
jgi:hypothetical protein